MARAIAPLTRAGVLIIGAACTRGVGGLVAGYGFGPGNFGN